ncbi:hypothetical protein J2Y45_003115 [Dyadobacter sp. BE34]|uniref:Uncharacterized protein n=1 Tax=Dyadobacter fermentans TaxID=94254 RepID=A0ABU1QTV8_9BACT|nr:MULTISPECIES: hypothetical protein [Dyadobacter]MDR6804576.1 hypothetical protein [Dyadobacter fermentans]MDR7043664.1 hypothetical protein [Dyadobacter sp. BE242]MDR7197976.1 hypothetical protein [Dyadobacter sp. BE34]MDR7214590.1 hypothetical protein [Dyadobacter sp. BE31]MDR7262125.1 hypothetical protein [Dyadobacter sp. BE32]
MLNDKSYRQRVQTLSEEFAQYQPVQLVEQYVNGLLNEPHQRLARAI